MPDFYTTELWKILKTLEEGDIAALKQATLFLMGKEDAEVVRLLEWVEQNSRPSKLKGAELTNHILTEIFPGVELEEAQKKFKDVRSRAQLLAKEFLAWRELQNAQVQKSLVLCRVFRKRNLWDLYEKEIAELHLKFLSDEGFYDEDPEGERLSLLKEVYHLNHSKFGKEKNKGFKIDAYPTAFLINALSERLLQILLHQIWTRDSNVPMREPYLRNETLQYAKSRFYTLPIRAQLLYSLCQSTMDDAESKRAHIMSALELWEKGKNALSAFEEYHVFLYLAACFAAWANIAERSAEGFRALERVYNRCDLEKIQLVGAMPPRFLLNTIIVYTNQGKFEASEKFCAQFSKAVNEKFRETFRNCSRLLICVKRGNDEDWVEAADIISPANNLSLDDTVVDAMVRVQKAKIHYHLGELDALESHMEAFRKFIENNADTLGYQSERFKNFNNAMMQLVRRRRNKEDENREIKNEQVENLVKSFSSPMPIGEEEWLKESAMKLREKGKN